MPASCPPGHPGFRKENASQVAAEGEGSLDSDDSHFARFLAMFRGVGTLPVPPPPPSGTWVPALPVPTDPNTASIAEARTRRWAQLADIRYAMLLGEIEHHLRTNDGGHRGLLMGWAIEDMFGLESFASTLVTLPLGTGVACLPFTMPTAGLPLPDTETDRWQVHLARVSAALDKINEMRADPADAANAELTALLTSLGQRRDTINGALPTTSFDRDIRPLFPQIDVDHMKFRFNLSVYDSVKASAAKIADRIKRTGAGRMPPPPDVPLTAEQTALFDKWVSEGFPP
jgi:hypothetical protein